MVNILQNSSFNFFQCCSVNTCEILHLHVWTNSSGVQFLLFTVFELIFI